MSLSYQCIGHMAYCFRVFYVARVGTLLFDLYFNYSQNCTINELLENGWSPEGASFRYIILKSCESIVAVFALASCIAVLSRFFHKMFLSFMIVDDAESASSAGTLAGWLFIVICFQCGITSLPEEDRYWRLLRNLGLIVIVNLHSLFKPVSDRLQSLSASRSKTIHKHARVLLVGISSIILPTWFLIHLWSQKAINSWTLTVTVFGFEMIFRMSVSLIIYTMCMINSFCDVNWRSLEDQIYYLKASCGMISYLCGISLFFNGTWVLLFENSTALRAVSLCVHLYFNIWNQAWKGWNVFNKRRLASTKMNYLRDATKSELIALDDVCSICFQQLDHAKVTGCNHYFHTDCLTRWLYLQDTCPICCSAAAITITKDTPSSSTRSITSSSSSSSSSLSSSITTSAPSATSTITPLHPSSTSDLTSTKCNSTITTIAATATITTTTTAISPSPTKAVGRYSPARAMAALDCADHNGGR